MPTGIDKNLPPHNSEAEQSVIGSILLDKEAMLKVADILVADDFYEEQHRAIFQTILDLFKDHKTIDILTLTNALEEKKKLEDVGGSAYLSELVNAVPTATHVEQYAAIVKQKATLRRLINAAQQITALGFDENDPTDEVLEKAERVLFNVSQNFMRNKFTHIKNILDESYERIAELQSSDDDEAYRGVPTGYYDLDSKLSGLQRSDLIVLAARPSMGKTALALNIAQNIAKDKDKTVGIFSFEMSKEQLVERMFCSLLGVDSWKLRTGRLENKDLANIGNVMDDLSKTNMYIDDSASCNIVELRTKARRLQAEQGLDLLVVDYLQLMTGNNPNNRVSEISEISRSLKILARELKIPLLAISQLSRAVESRTEKIPQLSDLRESGSIEQDADVVLFLYRDDYYNPDTTDKPGITDVFISKHRTGPTGRVQLGFKKEQIKFINIEKHRKGDEYGETSV